MITHVCPVCSTSHQVREIRAALAYGRQLTCSPDCESVRRRRMRERPADEAAPATLHAWVVASTEADLMRTAGMLQRPRARRR